MPPGLLVGGYFFGGESFWAWGRLKPGPKIDLFPSGQKNGVGTPALAVDNFVAGLLLAASFND